MTVKKLRQWLETFPDDLPVAYQCCGEAKLLERNALVVRQLPRADGRVPVVGRRKLPLPAIPYLMFPGN